MKNVAYREEIMFRVGIVGAGKIAGSMAKTLAGMTDVCFYAIASRSQEKADAFAAQFSAEKSYGSYEEMLQDDQVDLVYIATPHSHHYEHMKLCLQYGRPVLCEKAFTMNADQAKAILKEAEEKKIFVTEAIWTRYMPLRRKLDEILQSGMIGTPQILTANLGYLIMQNERIAKPELAGGALLDVGVYPLNFTSMAFGDDVEEIIGTAVMTPLGVDAQNSMTIRYKDGRMAVLNSSAVCLSDRKGMIFGSNGYLEVENINNPARITVYSTDRIPVASYQAPAQISGYEYQVEACMEALKKGELECPQMPHAETIRMMEWMDGLRRQWNMVYPQER